MSSCYRSVDCIGFDLAWFTSLSYKCLCVLDLHSAEDINGASIKEIFFAYILLFTFW